MSVTEKEAKKKLTVKEFLKKYKVWVGVAAVLIVAIVIGVIGFVGAKRTNTELQERLGIAEEESRALVRQIEDLEEELLPENESQLKMDEALDNGYAPRDYEPYNVEH